MLAISLEENGEFKHEVLESVLCMSMATVLTKLNPCNKNRKASLILLQLIYTLLSQVLYYKKGTWNV